MNSQIMDEIIEELSSTLQRIEAQSAALLEFIKEKGIAKDDELAPYLERANEASSVRWRAARVRLEHLLSGLEKSERHPEEKEQPGKQKRLEEAQQQNEGAKSESQKRPEESAAGGPWRAANETAGKRKEQSAEGNLPGGASSQQPEQKTPIRGTPQGKADRSGESSQSHAEPTTETDESGGDSGVARSGETPNRAGINPASNQRKAV